MSGVYGTITAEYPKIILFEKSGNINATIEISGEKEVR